MQLLYDSDIDKRKPMLKKFADIPCPNKMGAVLLTHMDGSPEKAAGTIYEDSVRREQRRTAHLPGLVPADLIHPYAYDTLQPCTGIVLYHNGFDLCADTEHPYGRAHTIIRFLPAENYEKAWAYLGKTDKKSWYKIMRHTVAAYEAIPELKQLARPCRLMPVITVKKT